MRLTKNRDFVNIHEAKTNLSRLIERVQLGEEFIIAKSGRPVAMLVPLRAKKQSKRQLGLFQGRGTISPDFADPLSDDDLDRWQ